MQDTITLFVEEVGEGDVLLSLHKAERLAVWNWSEEQRESGTAVKVKVISESWWCSSRGAAGRALKAILAHRPGDGNASGYQCVARAGA